MKRSENRNEIGIKTLIRKGRKQFRVNENLRYYETDSLRAAEKKTERRCHEC